MDTQLHANYNRAEVKLKLEKVLLFRQLESHIGVREVHLKSHWSMQQHNFSEYRSSVRVMLW